MGNFMRQRSTIASVKSKDAHRIQQLVKGLLHRGIKLKRSSSGPDPSVQVHRRSCALLRLGDQLDKCLVEARVFGQLRVERRAHDVPLRHEFLESVRRH